MADPSLTSNGIVGDNGEDLLAHLARKKQEAAAFQEAAEVAREGAIALLRAQRRAAEIDNLAYGDAALPEAGGPDNEPAVAEGVCPQYDIKIHEHPVWLAGDLEPWICDGCRREFTDPASYPEKRYTCIKGCDFDLCEECVAGGVGVCSPLAVSAAPLPLQPASPPGREAAQDDDDLSEPFESCLSPEDRRRFGLEDSALGQAPSSNQQKGAGGGASTPMSEDVPRWSTLSAEDRLRFGLDGSMPLPPVREERFGQPPVDKASLKQHPEVLWGHGPSSMTRTLAQLEAVGAMSRLADLEETERQLQIVRMMG
jgi:hypothetical protein